MVSPKSYFVHTELWLLTYWLSFQLYHFVYVFVNFIDLHHLIKKSNNLSTLMSIMWCILTYILKFLVYLYRRAWWYTLSFIFCIKLYSINCVIFSKNIYIFLGLHIFVSRRPKSFFFLSLNRDKPWLEYSRGPFQRALVGFNNF